MIPRKTPRQVEGRALLAVEAIPAYAALSPRAPRERARPRAPSVEEDTEPILSSGGTQLVWAASCVVCAWLV